MCIFHKTYFGYNGNQEGTQTSSQAFQKVSVNVWLLKLSLINNFLDMTYKDELKYKV